MFPTAGAAVTRARERGSELRPLIITFVPHEVGDLSEIASP